MRRIWTWLTDRRNLAVVGTAACLVLLAAAGLTAVALHGGSGNGTAAAAVGSTSARGVKPGVELASGKESDKYERTYRCATGYTAVDVPVGKLVNENGAWFEITEKRNAYRQVSLNVTAALGKKTRLGGVIIITSAHVLAPTTYPQFKLDIPLTGGSATFKLQSSGYVTNYAESGISHLRFCVA